MKKLFLALVALIVLTTSAQAMSYEQARERALFLTDKMAYELNLTDDQYEAAYEINLDYLMTVNTADDLYGTYWRQRNLDLSYILLDWQYRTFCAASYFYRPLYFDAGCWHFGIYARYPHRTYFYFGHPHFYTVYRGGHSWRLNGGRSWYHGRTFGGPRPDGGHRVGMRDGFDRGDFGHGFNGGRPAQPNNQGPRRFGNPSAPDNNRGNNGINQNRNTGVGHFGSRNDNNGTSQSSTRTNVNITPVTPNNNIRFGSRSNITTNNNTGVSKINGVSNVPNRTFTPVKSDANIKFANPSSSSHTPTRSFGGSNSSSSTRSFGGSSSSSSSRSFGGSSSSSSRSFGGSSSSSSRSFGGGSSSSSRSFGGGSRVSSTRSTGGSTSGGGHFGGRR